MKREPPIFGSQKRTRYLIGIAKHEPISGRALARLLHLDPKEMPELFRLFNEAGAVVRNDAMKLRLNERFFAFSELTVLLHALAGQRVIVVPDISGAHLPAVAPHRLFGSKSRTKILVALHALGSANAADVASVSGVSARTVRATYAALSRSGLITSSKTVHDVIATFDARHPCAPALEALVARVLESYPQIAAVARFVQARRAEELRSQREPGLDGTLMPIGTTAQARVLHALIDAGPLTTSSLAKSTRCSINATRSASKDLERHGLVVRTVVGRGRRTDAWLALNDAHPIVPPLRNHFPKRTSGALNEPLRELPPRGVKTTAPVQQRTLPGIRIRMRMLIETFEVQQISLTDLAHRIQRPDLRRVRAWAQQLASMGLIDYGLVRGTATLRIAATSTSEAKALVAAIKTFLRGP